MEQRFGVCQQLRHLSRIQKISFGFKSIGFEGAQVLAESVTSWGPDAPLVHLDLDRCEIRQSGCVALLGALSSCKKLKHLGLSLNPIMGTFQSLDKSLVFPSLLYFHIGSTSLFQEDIRGLASIIRNNGLPKLEHLILGYNVQIMESDCMTLPPRYFDYENLVSFTGATAREADEITLAWTVILDNIGDVKVEESYLEVRNHDLKEIIIAELHRRLLQYNRTIFSQ